MSFDEKDRPVSPKDAGKYEGLEPSLKANRELTLGGRYCLQEFEALDGSCRVYVNDRLIKESYDDALKIIIQSLKVKS